MKLGDLKRRLKRLQAAIAPPPPPAPLGPPRVIFMLPDNGHGPNSSTGEDVGPYSSRVGDVLMIIYDPANPPPQALSHDGQAPTDPPTGAGE